MSKELEFFHIDYNDLPKDKTTFPFNLYLFNKVRKSYGPFLYANSPLIKQKSKFLLKTIEQGNELAIPANQRKTFMNFLGIVEKDDYSDVLETNNNNSSATLTPTDPELTELIKNKQIFLQCIERDDFTRIIEITRNLILKYPQDVSIEINYAIEFTKKTLPVDHIGNRIFVMVYFLALHAEIRSLEHIGLLLTATYLHHIGITALPPQIFSKPFVALTDTELKYYQKHPAMSEYIIKKMGILVKDELLEIINQHHERENGKGFPDARSGEGIHPLALILGASSHALEYSSGLIDGEKHSLIQTLKMMQNESNSQTTKIESSFGTMVKKSIEAFLA